VIYLNQLAGYQERWLAGERTTAWQGEVSARLAQPQASPGAALVVSNYSLAQQGKPEAIAHYLSEILSLMGVAVQVSVKTIPWKGDKRKSAGTPNAQPTHQRLWITCESAYSPDATLLAEPIATRLRELKLEGFRDALIFSQVQGETRPDWVLRVDLTPPDQMLREWARWGDVPAIARLLNYALKEQTIQVSVSLKESTLHIICTSNQQGSSIQQGAAAVAKQPTLSIVAPLLEQIAPQGIQAATVYGFKHWRSDGAMPSEPPLWVDWLELPAQIHPALAESTLTLAQQGDREAILFLLTRLLNPDLETHLATGGIRVQLLQKGDLLHIMTDAPLCPEQRQIGGAIDRCLRPLKIPQINGVRVYGRRSGQKRPLWSYGIDFNPRRRVVPEATPEFAASEVYIGDLLAKSGTLALRSELSDEDIPHLMIRWRQQSIQTIQQWLLRTRLFELETSPRPTTTAAAEATSQSSQAHNLKLALVWGAVGLLLAVNVDWMLGLALKSAANPPQPKATQTIAPPKPTPTPSSTVATPPVSAANLPKLSLKKSKSDGAVFNPSGFTGSAERSVVLPTDHGTAQANGTVSEAAIQLPASPFQPMSTVLASRNAAGQAEPTFNSRQLDEKLALYRERVAETGPPDILIIGSSRALRGVDPIALEKALAAQGYPGIKVFNFGINGATVQVVNLILQEFLTPQQLPKLVLWADGARAFNSGRVDITYNGIKVSSGYKQLMQSKTTPTTTETAPAAEATPTSSTVVGAVPAANPIATKNWLEQFLGRVSVTYPQRDRLKTLLQDKLAGVLPGAAPALPPPTILLPDSGELAKKPRSGGAVSPASLPSEGQGLIDINGFLPLSNRFNPATYYQKYARVSGDYDSDYESFDLTGKQVTALNQLTTFTQSKQIPLVFVNLPLTEDYLDPIRRDYENEFQQGIYSLAAAKKFVYIDLAKLWLSENDYFSDPSHLNRYGAYAVSQRLAQNVLIPWQMVKATSPNSSMPQGQPSP
jgi:hypothetical protein